MSEPGEYVLVQIKRLQIGSFDLISFGTVVETSFATLKLDSPPLISIYYLPYKNGELKKIVFYSGHYNSSK